ncbi:hypothetical protein CEK26_002833 [Fusarium fujikuroi]|nr:hypothetical protein CEK27_002828 [Fusarium fujikuroi]QGI87854.1 hypothetical protein CEK25_002810 [Fusarium fujikuroi]QGJ01389.1 hypothetical protein CEK26_002833 [Fusarium fujikuroi]
MLTASRRFPDLFNPSAFKANWLTVREYLTALGLRLPYVTEFFRREGILEKGSPCKALKQLLLSIANIRHTAIYRLRISSFIANAEDLVDLLGDIAYSKSISQLRANQQAELDRQEQEAINNTREEDRKYQAVAGKRVQKALKVIGNLGGMDNRRISPLKGFGSIRDMAEDYDDNLDKFEDYNE